MTTDTPAGDQLLTEREKAEQLKLSMSYLQKDRQSGDPKIPYVKFGRAIRYTRNAGITDK
jgi:hypothetical protein